MTLAIVESSSGAASASATNDAITSAVAGQDQHAADDRADAVQAELQAGHDAEVAAAAADRPEQVGMVLGVGAHELAVCRHDVGGQQIVDREAVLADEEPDAAAQRDPADPDRARVAEARGEAVRARRGRVRARGQAGLGPRGAPLARRSRSARMSVRSSTMPPSRDAVAGRAVAAAAHGQLEPRLARERDDARDVRRVGDPGDHGGAAVDRA